MTVKTKKNKQVIKKQTTQSEAHEHNPYNPKYFHKRFYSFCPVAFQFTHRAPLSHH